MADFSDPEHLPAHDRSRQEARRRLCGHLQVEDPAEPGDSLAHRLGRAEGHGAERVRFLREFHRRPHRYPELSDRLQRTWRREGVRGLLPDQSDRPHPFRREPGDPGGESFRQRVARVHQVQPHLVEHLERQRSVHLLPQQQAVTARFDAQHLRTDRHSQRVQRVYP